MPVNHSFRYAHCPQDVRSYGTEELREHFLIEQLFVKDDIQLCYSMYDRLIVGGAMPVYHSLLLETIPYLKSSFFLERRELGIINVGGKGTIQVDGVNYFLEKKEALYIGKGCQEIIFMKADNIQNPPLFYINSAPAHASFPIKKVGRNEAEIIHLGEQKNANQRILNKLIVNSLVQTCQLQMGLTELKEGNVWNTMPSHTHHRRMEAYFYFDLKENSSVCHLMGEPQHTRHLFVQNHQAVLSPEWSIHSGVGTSNYCFIWGMAGENLDYSDMDICLPHQLR